MNNENEKRNNIRDIDKKNPKEPLWYFAWLTNEKLDKKTYWLFILVLLLIYAIPNIIKMLILKF